MDEKYYIKLIGTYWFVFDDPQDMWVAKCHSKPHAEFICRLLNAQA